MAKKPAKSHSAPAVPPPPPLALGDWVYIQGMPGSGQIVELDPRRKRARVAIGGQDWLLKLAMLERAPAPEAPPPSEAPFRVAGAGAPQYVADLHGMRVEEALVATEALLDQAMVNHLPSVRIIHGHGSGALREAVRKLLSAHPQVARYRFGQPYEGGLACTVAEMKQT